MSLPRAIAVTVLAALASTGVSAQMYKCQQDGRTTYQEQPCAGGGSETRMSGATGWAAGWVGCYEPLPPKVQAPASKVLRPLRVRSVAGGLVLDIEGVTDNVSVRRMTKAELQVMERGMDVVSGGARYPDGLAIPSGVGERGSPDGAPLGIYRVVEADGREELHAALPLAGYPVRKVRCKSP